MKVILIFFLPKHLLLGCQCKKACSKNCGCKKDQYRKTCAMATCKFCSCFIRKPATSEENVCEESSNESSDNKSVYSDFSDTYFESNFGTFEDENS